MGNRSSVCWRKRFTLKLNAKGKDGTTPLDWAGLGDRVEIAAYFANTVARRVKN